MFTELRTASSVESSGDVNGPEPEPEQKHVPMTTVNGIIDNKL